VLLQGAPGAGRGALLAALARELDEDPDGGADGANVNFGANVNGAGAGAGAGAGGACLVVHVERSAGASYSDALARAAAEVAARGCGDPGLPARRAAHLAPCARLGWAIAEARRVACRRVVLLFGRLSFSEAPARPPPPLFSY